MNAPVLQSLRRGPLDCLFTPRSIAVAGATTTERKFGKILVEQLAANFTGELYPIHPTHREVAGRRAYADPSQLPGPVDLLVALLPGRHLLRLVEACRPGQVKMLLAIPAGFGEVSAEGLAIQAALVTAARTRGMRMVGPNIMGVINAAAGINASLAPGLPPGGRGLSILTQSGGFALAVTMYALDHQLPIAKISDLGNMADLQLDEALRYLAEDPDTEVIGLFLETGGEPESCVAAMAAAAARKPVILSRLGRTPTGRAASIAHLGTTRAVTDVEGVAETGVLAARTGLDLLDLAKGLAFQPRPAGRRMGLLTATGGVATELADLCAEHGLEVPVLSEKVQRQIAELLPPFAITRNPIDLTPIWWQFQELYPAIVNLLLDSGEVDALVVSVTDVPTEMDDFVVALRNALAHAPRDTGKPAFVFWGSRDHVLANMRLLEGARIPCYRSTEQLVRVVAAMAGSAEGAP